jgi:hypothetical protein
MNSLSQEPLPVAFVVKVQMPAGTRPLTVTVYYVSGTSPAKWKDETQIVSGSLPESPLT